MMRAALLFARASSWGWPKGAHRELVDVTYTPRDPPYVPHADTDGLHRKV